MPAVGAGMNTFTPAFDPAATGSLQIEFTRNPKTFKLNRYSQLIPVTQLAGYYMRVDPKNAVRIVNEQDGVWPIGQDRPTGDPVDVDLTPQFACKRFTDGFNVPNETADSAKFDVVAMHARIAATKAMTRRTLRSWTTLTTAANYTSGENLFANTTALVGGAKPWNSGADNANIQEGVQAAVQRIQLNTAGVVGPESVVMVCNPNTAKTISQQPEIRNYVKNYPAAMEFLKGSREFSTWNLPGNLFGLGDVVVEDAVRVTTRRGASTQTTTYVCPDNVVLFLGRPGGLIGVEGVPTFSALSIFAYEDMTIETFGGGEDQQINRRMRGGVTDNSDPNLTAPASAVYLQTCFT